VGTEAAALVEDLRARGAHCDHLPSAAGISGTEDLVGIVWLAEGEGIAEIVDLIQRITSQGRREPPRVWLVTRGTQAVTGSATSLVGAGLWGLGRTLMYEHAELHCTLIDTTSTAEDLAAEIACASTDDQVALRPEGRYVARLRPMGPRGATVPTGQPAGARPFALEVERPGHIDRLCWRATHRRAPGPGEVEVAVDAAGLNFLDVLWTLGQYPGQTTGPSRIGREFAGHVVAAGPGVDPSFAPGAEVIGCAEGSLATHVLANGSALAMKPALLSAIDAAGQPVAFATAYWSLID
jgi:hypothetical protein